MSCQHFQPPSSVTTTEYDRESDGRANSSFDLRQSESTGPNERRRCNSVDNMKASDFADKIRQLEHEGSRLRRQVDTIMSTDINDDPVPRLPERVSRSMDHLNIRSEEHEDDRQSPFLSSLSGISAERKTIDSMRAQLDDLKNFRLRNPRHDQYQPIIRHSPLQRVSPVATLSSTPNLSPVVATAATKPPIHPDRHHHQYGMSSSLSPLPLTTEQPAASAPPARRAIDFLASPAQSEREIRSLRGECERLRRHAAEADARHAVETDGLAETIDALRTQLFDTEQSVHGAKTVYEGELRERDHTIEELHAAIVSLQDANQEHQELLVQTSQRMHSTHKEEKNLEAALFQIRSILAEEERKRGEPFFETDPVTKQVPGLLSRTLDRCLQELYLEIDALRESANEAKYEAQHSRKVCESESNNQAAEFSQNVDQMRLEYDSEIMKLRDDVASRERQLKSAESELEFVRRDLQEQLDLKTETLVEFEDKIKHQREQYNAERNEWNTKRKALEHCIDNVEQEARNCSNDRDDAMKEVATMESKILYYEREVERLNQIVKEDRVKEERIEQLQAEIDERDEKLVYLQGENDDLKETADETVRKQVLMIVGKEKESLNCKIDALTRERNESREEYALTKSALDEITQRAEKTHVSNIEMERKLELFVKKLEGHEEEIEQQKRIIDLRDTEVDRLSQEREYYYNLLDEKTVELGNLKGEFQLLVVELEEKENHLHSLESHSKQCESLFYQNKENTHAIREERSKLMADLTQAKSLLDQGKTDAERTKHTLLRQKKRITELEEVKARLEEELSVSSRTLQTTGSDRQILSEEVVDRRSEMALLVKEVDSLKTEILDTRKGYNKKLAAASKQLEEARNEIKRVKSEQPSVLNNIGDTDASENKRRRSAKDDKLNKENDRLRAENGKLCDLMKRMSNQNEQLAKELDYYVNKSKELRERVTRLEERKIDHGVSPSIRDSAAYLSATKSRETSNPNHSTNDEMHSIRDSAAYPPPTKIRENNQGHSTKDDTHSRYIGSTRRNKNGQRDQRRPQQTVHDNGNNHGIHENNFANGQNEIPSISTEAAESVSSVLSTERDVETPREYRPTSDNELHELLGAKQHGGAASPVEELLLTPLNSARDLSDETRRALMKIDSFGAGGDNAAAGRRTAGVAMTTGEHYSGSGRRGDHHDDEVLHRASSGGGGNATFADQANEMCRQLQQRICDLSRLGDSNDAPSRGGERQKQQSRSSPQVAADVLPLTNTRVGRSDNIRENTFTYGPLSESKKPTSRPTRRIH